ncbi:MFS transporter [Arenivirga flava]|uniref:MFS transporter n=1 Tax=Arenivirga flava TaxID=1930060 RepID=A0AA37UFD4_9MICO|nr:MFS transporter [Arenivirga flava]GMA27934.1 MFS transporter [Arenivirga flava]
MSTPPIARLQRRTVGVLVAGQILGGVGIGAAFSVGALLVARIAGESLSGFATTSTTLGAALAAIPLARLASRRGRGPALATGALLAGIGAVVVVVASVLVSAPLVFAGLVLLGCSTAANLQARFAAADLAEERHRGRDLSIVVWSTTIGAVAGPNLAGAGEALGAALQLPPLTGPFLFPVVSQLLAAILLITALRPDPLRTARALETERADADAAAVGGAAAPPAPGGEPAPLTVHPPARVPRSASAAIALVALSHATMVAVMSMTPVHLQHHGASLVVIGVTISLHVVGMYGFSPLFGILADRWGRVRTAGLGLALLLASLVVAALGGERTAWVVVALVLLGLGWSGATIAGAGLLGEGLAPGERPRLQGRSDLAMNLAGAGGSALAGTVLSAAGYAGLATASALLVAGALAALLVIARERGERMRASGTARGIRSH